MFLLSGITNGVAQVTQGTSTQGKEFWMSWGKNAYAASNGTTVVMGDNSREITLAIRVAVEKTTTVNFHFTNNPSLDSTQTVPANSIFTFNLSGAQKIAAFSNATGATTKSIYVTSDENVSVYAITQFNQSSDATLILPVNNLGTDYYHVSYRPAENENNYDGYTIVATEDNTTLYMSDTIQAVLNAGDVYSYYFTPVQSKDGTGTHITSDNPIAYFVTNSMARVPYGGTSYARDPLYQQLFSVDKWGTNFIVPGTIQKIGRVRILASQDGTTVTQNSATGEATNPQSNATVTGPAASYSLNTGKWIELEFKTAGCYISADKPIIVCAYLVSNSYSNNTGGSGLGGNSGDPAMTYIPPIEQSLNSVMIAPFIMSGSALATHYALIVTPTLTKDQTTVSIGGATPTALGITWTDNADSGYSFGSYQLTQNTTYQFSNLNGMVVNGYGVGFNESYYYVSGTASRDLTAYYNINNYFYSKIGERAAENFMR
ncbi:hypothetical protein AGMMS50262_23630 [Bacteroidia bacterium]|nr:hypothetical protein AGMMS50262_23630 [Bacteroidia bacterium]